MNEPKYTLGYWLNSRAGYYDPATINRLQNNQAAFNTYIEQCEKVYQKQYAAKVERETGDADRLKSLNEQIRAFLQAQLFSIIRQSAAGDVSKIRELLSQEHIVKLIEMYELQTIIKKQYQECRNKRA